MIEKSNVYLVSLFTLVSLLAACGGPNAAARPAPVTDQVKVLRDTAKGWTGEDAVVRAEAYNAEDEYVVLAQAPVTADGSFSLSLPGAESVDDILFTLTKKDLLCETAQGTTTGTADMTPSRLEMTAVELTVYPSSLPDSNNEDYLGSFHLEDAEESVEVVQVYAAEDAASMRASCTFSDKHEDPKSGERVEITVTITVDLDLVAG